MYLFLDRGSTPARHTTPRSRWHNLLLLLLLAGRHREFRATPQLDANKCLALGEASSSVLVLLEAAGVWIVVA